MARMVIKYENENGWVVTDVAYEHNHILATPSKSYLLRSQRSLKSVHEVEIANLNNVGISPVDGFDYLSQKAGGRQNIGITHTDYKNHLRKKRAMDLGHGDACVVLYYFTRKQVENPAFFYSVLVDEDDKLTNFFWADARSVLDYNYFGDVVVFDTTYRTNRYGRPFAPFVGVNHHRQTVIFGATLLLDETTESFIWLFEMWMKAMSGRQPKSILTDQCAAMAKAISIVLPETRHRLCLWHIFQNSAKHLSHVYMMPGFQRDFKKCIYSAELEDEFYSRWNQMLQDYDLTENKWLHDMFKIREKWALVFVRDTFCADMTTTQRSESINKFLKKFVKRKYCFIEFLGRYERALEARREKELHEDFYSVQTSPVLLVPSPMLKQAAEIYTRGAFEIFSEEYREWILCKIVVVGIHDAYHRYEVTQERQRNRVVDIDSSNNEIVCTCKKFEFVGILCRHIIKVLYHINVHDLPIKYILKRWTKAAKRGIVFDKSGDPIQEQKTDMSGRYSELCRRAIAFATKGAVTDNVYLVALNALDNALEEVEEATKRSQQSRSTVVPQTHSTSENFMPSMGVAQGSERGRPSSVRLMSGLEKCQRKKKGRAKLVDSDKRRKVAKESGQIEEVASQVVSQPLISNQEVCSYSCFPQLLPQSVFDMPLTLSNYSYPSFNDLLNEVSVPHSKGPTTSQQNIHITNIASDSSSDSSDWDELKSLPRRSLNFSHGGDEK